MTRKKRKSTKKPKKVVIVEKQVPDFDDIENAVFESYALISVAYTILVAGDEDDHHGHAIVALRHGTNLLKQTVDRFDHANARLSRFCRQNNLPQEDVS